MCGPKTKPTVIEPSSMAFEDPRRSPCSSTPTSPRNIPTTRSPPSTRNTEPSETSRHTESYKTAHTTLPSQTSQTPIPSTAESEDPSTSENLKDLSKASTSTNVYTFSEICNATGFLDKRLSFSSSPYSSAWRCSMREKDVMVFQRKFHHSIETSQIHERLSLICKSHHVSLIKLLGACISGNHIYLIYDYVNGTNLADCLRNPRNPSFTVLSTWISRMQIAIDLAQGLEYIHHYIYTNLSLVHKHIKSSSLIVTLPSFNAKICHFGTAELCGEIIRHQEQQKQEPNQEITEISDDSTPSTSKLKRSDSGIMKFEGTIGYMSPEFKSIGVATQKSDVFAFGIVILELLSGEEPVKYRIDKETKDYWKICVIETARDAIDSQEPGRIRRWVDRRLKDSFPVEVAEKLTRLALDCVNMDAEKRPDMRRVAGKIYKLYLESRRWADQMRLPTDFTTSFTAR